MTHSILGSMAVLVIVAAAGFPGVPAYAATNEAPVLRETVPAKPKLDRSGHKRIGKASIYAKKFAGRKMANGAPMKPHGDNAASKTLPLGTVARVTNLATGQSAIVTIQDRGPYIKGRIVDLSPHTAQKLGMERVGVAQVEVSPILIPQPDGGVKLGDAAHDG